MSQGVREVERVTNIYRLMSAIEDKAEYDEDAGYILTERDFRNAVTESLYIIGRRSINDWYKRLVELGFIVKLGTSGNLHYAKETWRNSPICRAARTMPVEAEIECDSGIQVIDLRRSR